MAKPTNKKELVSLSEENYSKLITHIESLDDKSKSKAFKEGTLNRNVRDVIAHLHHWHLLQLGWYEVGMQGDKPHMPAEGYTWTMMPKLNLLIREKYQDLELSDALQHLESSHASIMSLIDRHSDTDLFTKKKYRWTGSTSLGAYLTSNTCSHYAWAYKLIRKQLK